MKLIRSFRLQYGPRSTSKDKLNTTAPLDVHLQLGVDVFARTEEFNKRRVQGRIPFPVGDLWRGYLKKGVGEHDEGL